jgi:hypothetical protein
MQPPERDPSALLIERLLGDASFRERFKSDPVTAFREAGVDGPPEDLARTAGKAMETLEIRESRSSLAGVMMAGAIEALAVFGVADHASAAQAADLPRPVSAAPRAQVSSLPVQDPPAHGGTPVVDAHSARASEHVDPSEYGQGGTGGPPSAETLALLHNRNVTFDSVGKADLRAGRIDPRIVAC